MKRVGWKEAREKVEREGKCRVCSRSAAALAADGLRLEAAHLAPRQFDEIDRELVDPVRVVDPHNVVGLCGPATTSMSCHGRFDGGVLDILPYLTKDEQAAVVRRIGIVAAMRRLLGE